MILNVAGGLAAQLFALAYAFLIHPIVVGRPVVIRFTNRPDLGRQWNLGTLMQVPLIKSKNIRQRVIPRWWGWLSGLFFAGLERRNWINRGDPLSKIPPTIMDSRTAVERATSRSRVLNPSPSEYLSDFRVLEQVWPSLSQVISSIDGEQNFVRLAGSDRSIAVHWRLGDYLATSFHGFVPLVTLLDQISEARSRFPNFPVRFFSDSPEVVRKKLEGTTLENFEVIDEKSIWKSLKSMTRSMVFIGTNSGISLIASMAVHHSQVTETAVYLPSSWFIEEEKLMHSEPECFAHFRLYEPRLVVNR